MLHYVKYKTSGFALVTVLLFMQILALLGLYSLEHVLLAEKMTQAYYQKNHTFNLAESALNLAEFRAPCGEIPLIDSHELAARPLSFWQTVSCGGIFPGLQYYYVTEFLGADSCADIEYQNATALYFRVTLMAVLIKQNARVILQSIIVKPDDAKKDCRGIHHTVKAGRQAWRTLF